MTRSVWIGRLSRQAFFLLVWVVILAGVVLVASSHWRRGLSVVAAAALLAGVLRLVLPVRRAGWLAVRGRGADVVCYAVFGAVLALLALTVSAAG